MDVLLATTNDTPPLTNGGTSVSSGSNGASSPSPATSPFGIAQSATTPNLALVASANPLVSASTPANSQAQAQAQALAHSHASAGYSVQMALARPSQQLRFFQALATKRCDDFTKSIHQLVTIHPPAVQSVVDEVNALLSDSELAALKRFALQLTAARHGQQSRNGNGSLCTDGANANNNLEDEANREEVVRQRDELLLEVSVLREQIDAQAERLKELDAAAVAAAAAARSPNDKSSVSQPPRDAALLIRSLEEENAKLRTQLAFAARLASAAQNANINDDAALLAHSPCAEANNEQQQPLGSAKSANDSASASARTFAYSAIKRSQTMMTASPRVANAEAALYEAIAQRLLLDSAGTAQLHSATSSSSLPAAYLHRTSGSTSAAAGRQAQLGANYHQSGRIGYQSSADDRGSQSSVQTTPPPASGALVAPAFFVSPASPQAAAFRRNTPFRATVTGATRLNTSDAVNVNGLGMTIQMPIPLPLPDNLGVLAGGPFAKPLVVQLIGVTPREARRIMMSWVPDTLHALLIEVGLDAYVDRCRHSIKTVAHFVDAVDRRNAHRLLGIKSCFHRKKLYFWMAALLVDAVRASRHLASVLRTLLVDWDHELVARWLDDAGLPEYKDAFRANRIDGLLLEVLTVDEAVHQLRITNELHHLSLKRAIQALRLVGYRYDRLLRRGATNGTETAASKPRESTSTTSTLDRNLSIRSAADVSPTTPDSTAKTFRNGSSGSPGEVVLWTNARVAQWLASIDLAEFASHLRGSGVHGALMVLEPRFTAELLADVLAIPPTRTLLRRHLKTQFVELLGAKVQARKREFAESTASAAAGHRRPHSHSPADAPQPLTLTSRVKSPSTKRSSLLLFSFRRRADKAVERRALSKLVDGTVSENNGGENSTGVQEPTRAGNSDPADTYLCPFNDATLKEISTELSVAFRSQADFEPDTDVDTDDWRPLSVAEQNGGGESHPKPSNGGSPQHHVRRARASNSNSVSLSAGVGGGVMRSSVNEADEDDDPDAHSSSGSSRAGAALEPNAYVAGNPLKIALNDAALLPKMPASNV